MKHLFSNKRLNKPMKKSQLVALEQSFIPQFESLFHLVNPQKHPWEDRERSRLTFANNDAHEYKLTLSTSVNNLNKYYQIIETVNQHNNDEIPLMELFIDESLAGVVRDEFKPIEITFHAPVEALIEIVQASKQQHNQPQ